MQHGTRSILRRTGPLIAAAFLFAAFWVDASTLPNCSAAVDSPEGDSSRALPASPPEAQEVDDAFLTKTKLPPSFSLGLVWGDGGAAAVRTVGSEGSVWSGYAVLDLNSGTTPYGTAVFSIKQNGVTVSEAVVPASPPTTSARIFVDYRSNVAAVPGRSDAGTVDINTGVAVVNYGSAMANVTYTLLDVAGTPLSVGYGTVSAGTHLACFVDQLKDKTIDFNLPSDFQTSAQFGSLDISSDQPISVVALRGTTNQRGEFIITTTPIADLTRPLGSDPTYFPQFVDGGGYTTSLVLMNTSSSIETGIIEIVDDDGNPLAVNQVAGTVGSSFNYSLEPNGVFRFQTDGFPATVQAGWARLTPDAGTSTPIGSGVFSYNPGSVLITESGVPAAVATTHARVYVDLSANRDTGLTIANVTDTNASITIDAFQTDGITGIGTSRGPLLLDANGHEAKFVHQFIAGLPTEFTGVLRISSSTPFAALTTRSLINERNDFLITTFPIADPNRAAPSPTVFPHVADGGGYATEFVLIGPAVGARATLNFYGSSDVVLAWDPMPQGEAWIEVRAYECLGADGYKLVGSTALVNGGPLTLTSVVPGLHRYIVRTWDGVIESGDSNEVSANVTAISAVQTSGNDDNR